MEFYSAKLPYYNCGFWVDDDDRIIDAAPIMYWAIGRKLKTFEIWARSRGGHVEKHQEALDRGSYVDIRPPHYNPFLRPKGSFKAGKHLRVPGKPSQVDSD